MVYLTVRRLPAFLFAIAVWAAATPLSAQNPAPPPIPAVAPLIGRIYSNDADGDRIDDQLAAKSRQALAAQAAAATAAEKTEALAKLNAKVEVELIFAEQITRKQIDNFIARGGEITHVYKAVSYGWNARIPLSKVAAIPALMGAQLLLIQEAVPMQLHMDKATQTGRVRPIWAAGFAGNVSGFDGDPNIAIAIVDTGVDESHPDLNGRRVYWHDFSTDALASPADLGQHGSHVAGIALGSGAAGGSGAGTLSFTQEESLNGVPNGSFYPSPIELPAASVTATMTATWNGGGPTTLHWLSRPRGSTTWDTAHGTVSGTSPLNLTTPLSGDLNREYSPGLLSNGHMNDFVVKCQVTNYPAAGDGFNKMRGVAPGCNWAGAKVFTNAGSGTSTAMSAAVDTLVANRAVNNIKVMNLSLGTIGNPGLNTSHRQKINTAVNNGIVVAVSAGNDGGTQQVDDPGRAAMALTVAAANDVNQLTDYTSEGFASPGSVAGQEEDYKPDLMAPGGSAGYYSSILSVDSNTGDGSAFSDQQANDYFNIQGTSMASPFAAGCAALVIDALQQSGVTWDFTSSQHSRYVKMILCATASESNSGRESNADNPTLQRAAAGPSGFPAGKDQYEGFGMINPDAAVEAVTLDYSPGATAVVALGPTATDRRVWARKVSLAGEAFLPTLTVPAGADFDLYLYSGAPNAYGTPVLLASSTTAATGGTETFTYTPGSAATVLLVVKRVAGFGTFTLSTPSAEPVLSEIEGTSLLFTENQTAVAITATLTVSDPDSSNLSGGTAGITSGFVSGQDVLAMNPNPQNGIAASYAPATGVLTLSGSSSVANYQAALRSVTYLNTSENPSTATRTITFSASDGTTSGSATRDIALAAVNDAPAATNLSENESYTEDTPLNLIVIVVSDADSAGVAATLTISNVAAGALSTATSGAVTSTYDTGTGVWAASGAVANVNTLLAGVTFTPATNFNDSFAIDTSVTDGVDAASTGSKAITGIPVNDAPVNTVPLAQTMLEDTSLVFSAGNGNAVLVADPDNSSLAVTLTAANGTATLATTTGLTFTQGDGAGDAVMTFNGALAGIGAALDGLSFAPAPDFNGAASITIESSDGAAGDADVVAIDVTAVNDAPTLDEIPGPAGISEDAAEQTISLSGISEGGGERQTLTVTATSDNPALIPNPAVTYTSPDATGSLTYTPVANAFGSATVTVTVDDGQAENKTISRTFTVTVTAVNDAPTLAATSDPAPILEDAAEQTIHLSGLSAGGGEGQMLTITATSDNPALIPNPTVTFTSPDATGSLAYTPVANGSGSATITVTVDDGQAENNIATRTFTVVVTAVNDVPTLAAISDPAPILEDAAEQTVNLVGISAGGESQTLTMTATSDNPALIPNPAVTYTSPDASGSLHYAPAADASGSATITVTVDDGQVENNTVVRTFTVSVTSVNDVPTLAAVSDPEPILEDAGEQAISLSGISAGGGESQTLTVTATSDNPALIPNPAVTYTSPDATGSLTYTPVVDAFGSATVTVTVDDGQAENNTISRTFTVNVTAVNDVPTLATISDPAPTLEDAGEQEINLSGISAGGGEAQTLTITAASDNLALIPNPTVTYTSPDTTGSLTYTPLANAFGSATISVTIDDGQEENNTIIRTFTVSVTSVNDLPTLAAVSDPAPILEDAAEQTVNLSGISAGGGEGQRLTITATSDNPALIPNPAVTYTSPDASGSLTYTPAADISGSAMITVTVDDGQAENNTISRTFTVTVTAVNDAPTLAAISDPEPILENAGEQTINLSGISAGGGESQTLTITAISDNPAVIPNPAVTYSSPDATGSLSYTSVANAFGSAMIAVTVNDGETANSTVVRTFTVTVTAPVIVIEQPEGTSLADGTGAVDFGIRLVGTGADLVFTVRNAGTADLTEMDITFDGLNARDFSVTAGAAAPLPPGGSTSFTVRFIPGSSGQRTAMLHIASNDPAASPFDLTLSGTGITPLENWRQTHFGTTTNTGEAADTADPNGNGILNIVEYALNGDPTGFGTGQDILPSASRGDTGCMQLSFRRYPDRTDVTLKVQAADSTGGPWTDLAVSKGGEPFTMLAVGAEVTETGTGPVREVNACDLYDLADPGHSRRFMKLEITQP